MSLTPNPSYYAVIPAHVRYCKEIEMGAKLLYGEITSLTHAEGYCWASNQYFADLYSVDVRTVKRWLKSLSDQKYIQIETSKKIDEDGITSIRKIWISPEIKKVFTKGQKCHGGGDKNVTGGGDKNVPHNIKDTNNINNPLYISPLKDERKNFGKHVKLTSEEYQDLKKNFPSYDIDKMIQKVNDYISSHGKKDYKDYAAAIRNFIASDEEKKAKSNNFSPVSPYKLATAINKIFPDMSYIGQESLELKDIGTNNLCYVVNISFTDRHFEDKIYHFFARQGKDTKKIKDAIKQALESE